MGRSPLTTGKVESALAPLSPEPILRTLNVSTDALTTNVRAKDRWVAGEQEEGKSREVEKARSGQRNPIQFFRTHRCVLGARRQTCRGGISLWDGGSSCSLSGLGLWVQLRFCETAGNLSSTPLQ